MANTVIEPTSISLRFTVVKFRNLTRNVRVARFLRRVSLALGGKNALFNYASLPLPRLSIREL